MAKRFSISISEWVYNEYLQGIKINRSKFIEEMIIKGINSEIGDYENNKTRIIELIRTIKNKELENNKLISEIKVLLKEKEDKKEDINEEEKQKLRVFRGIKANNPLRDEPGRF